MGTKYKLLEAATSGILHKKQGFKVFFPI